MAISGVWMKRGHNVTMQRLRASQASDEEQGHAYPSSVGATCL